MLFALLSPGKGAEPEYTTYIEPELENRSDVNDPTPVLYLALRHGRPSGFSHHRVSIGIGWIVGTVIKYSFQKKFRGQIAATGPRASSGVRRSQGDSEINAGAVRGPRLERQLTLYETSPLFNADES